MYKLMFLPESRKFYHATRREGYFIFREQYLDSRFVFILFSYTYHVLRFLR